MRWKWNYWCTNGSTIMLASCSKKQMQLEFMFSSLSEKRNQSKLPSKSCGVLQIPPTKICNRKQEPGNGRTEIHKAAVAPLAWGWQLRGSAFRLKGTSVFSSVSQNCDYHNVHEAEEWPVWGGRQEPLGRVGRAGISDSATQWPSQPCRAQFQSDSLNCVLAGMSTGETK